VAEQQQFVATTGSQFRPKPPIALESKEWAADYNELKYYGGQHSTKRTAQQTETARFWLVGPPVAYHPFVRQLVLAKQMSVVDSARFMALVALGLIDAIIAVLDAKYDYNFWRPITAIRNGDIDSNPDTEREATWQPMANTPMHRNIRARIASKAAASAGVVKAVLGTADIPEIAMTSPTAPGVTHRWTNTDGLDRRGRKCPNLGRLPLPLLDPSWHGDGASDRWNTLKNVMQPASIAVRR
jgi:hypothetical protein